MRKLLYLLIICALICACTKSKKPQTQQDQPTENTTQEVFVPDSAIVKEAVSDIVVEVEQPTVVESKPIKEKSTPRSNSYSSSSYSPEESGYWEEKRKHSPNDNYLLGFDEDVDDVHDMELYMEDY